MGLTPEPAMQGLCYSMVQTPGAHSCCKTTLCFPHFFEAGFAFHLLLFQCPQRAFFFLSFLEGAGQSISQPHILGGLAQKRSSELRLWLHPAKSWAESRSRACPRPHEHGEHPALLLEVMAPWQRDMQMSQTFSLFSRKHTWCLIRRHW